MSALLTLPEKYTDQGPTVGNIATVGNLLNLFKSLPLQIH